MLIEPGAGGIVRNHQPRVRSRVVSS